MIIDTSVLVDIDRGDNIGRIDKINNENHSISSATLMELSTGRYLNNTAESEFRKLFRNLEIIPIDAEIADRAGKIMAQLIQDGERIEINDVYIAATAIKTSKPILTGNTKHFKKLDEIETINWNKL